MRMFDYIVVLIVFSQLTFFGTIQSFGAVLCIEAGGRAEVEEHGCNCSVSPTTREDVDVHQLLVRSSDEHCNSCVDIPIGFGTDRIAMRAASKEKTKPNKLPSAEVVRVIPEPTTRNFMLTWVLPHDRGNPITTSFTSLRI